MNGPVLITTFALSPLEKSPSLKICDAARRQELEEGQSFDLAFL